MRALLLLLIALPSGAALSAPVTYDFTVTAFSGPLDGDTANGSFTFNSAIAPPGGGFAIGTGLLTSLAFTWDGITYTSATANTGFLEFNAAGAVIRTLFGTDCFSNGACSTSEFNEQWFFAAPDGFAYVTPTTHGGTGTVSLFLAGSPPPPPPPPPPSLPEPATLSLLALGLAGVGLTRRRKKI
jgi:hypothetical protein